MRAAALLVLLAGCGADNSLGGSVQELFPLEVSKVEVYRNEQAMKITYLRNRDTHVDVVVRMTFSLAGVEKKNGVKVDLAGEGDPGHARTLVEHAPGGEPVRQFPKVKRGDIVISRFGDYDQPSAGDFSMVFENEGGDLGAGRTLTGNFNVSRTFDAGYGELP